MNNYNFKLIQPNVEGVGYLSEVKYLDRIKEQLLSLDASLLLQQFTMGVNSNTYIYKLIVVSKLTMLKIINNNKCTENEFESETFNLKQKEEDHFVNVPLEDLLYFNKHNFLDTIIKKITEDNRFNLGFYVVDSETLKKLKSKFKEN